MKHCSLYNENLYLGISDSEFTDRASFLDSQRCLLSLSEILHIPYLLLSEGVENARRTTFPKYSQFYSSDHNPQHSPQLDRFY